jgi:transcriptional regulator with XRE-family HTH domain
MTIMDQKMTNSAGSINPHVLIGERVEKIRMARGMTRDKLAATLQDMGLDWSRLTVNRLEIGRRENITVIELLALCTALDIAPVDLLVPAYLENQSYRVAPKASAEASTVREWIRGEMQLYWSTDPKPGARFVGPDTAGELAAFVQWMPEDRARRVVRNYFLEGLSDEEYELASREERKKDLAEWLKEHGIGDDQ